MNDDKIKSQAIKPIAGNAISTSEDHPLHILDNQVDPAKKPRKFDVPQKPIRTYEKDMEVEIARLEAAGTPLKKPKSSFFSFKKKEDPIPKVQEKIETPTPPKEKFVVKEKPSFYIDKKVLNKEENDEYKINSRDTIDLDKAGKSSQQAIRTFEKDKEEALSHLKSKNIVPDENEIQEIPKVNESINIVARQIKEEEVIENEVEAPVVMEKPLKTFEEAVAESQEKLKVAKVFVESVKPVQPVQVEKLVPKPIPTPAPIPVPVPEPIPEPVLKPEILEKPQEKFRTYEGDVANNIKSGKSSVLSMAIAENVRRGGEEDISNIQIESHFGRNIAMALGSLVLIASGIGGGYYLYSISPLATVPAPQVIKNTSIVRPDKQIVLATDANNRLDFYKFISEQYTNNKPDDGKITEFILNQKLASSTERITGPQFVTKLGFNMTDTLKRSLQDKWMIGTYSVNGTSHRFIILKTDFFQNAFAGMLKWESSMPEDLIGIFNYSTVAVRGSFKDKVIMNRDVREYISLQGVPLFRYTFIDKDTILITTSEAVVPEILNRIEKQTYVR